MIGMSQYHIKIEDYKKQINERYILHSKTVMHEYKNYNDILSVAKILSSPTKLKLLMFLYKWRSYDEIALYLNIEINYAWILIPPLIKKGLIIQKPRMINKRAKVMKLNHDRLMININHKLNIIENI